MADPETGFIAAKVTAAVGGLLGGLTMMAFIKPKTIMDATLRGGISTATGIIFSIPMLEWLGWKIDMDTIMFMGFLMGFLSWSVFGLIARFFIKAEKNNEDIIDAAKKIVDIKHK